MVNEYFHQVSSTFEAAQCILFPILFTPIISQNCRHCKAPWLLCSINAISSHCLISPLNKLGRLELFYGVNSPRIIQPFTSLTTMVLDRGARIFSRIFFRYRSSSVNILYLLNFYDKNKKCVRLFVISRLF